MPASSTPVDLSRLPAPTIVAQPSFETILAELVTDMQALLPGFTATVESEPVMKLLQVFAYRELALRQQVNDAGRGVMLAYAAGAQLDQLAALFGVARLEVTPADPLAGTPAVMESDEALRQRVVLAPESYSVAGPELAYVFHARTAHPDVLDASATSPAPGEVLVTILSRLGDGTPEPDVLDAVEAVVNARTVRPLTDLVSVQPATVIPFAIAADLWLQTGPDPGVVIAAAQANIDTFVSEARRLGRDVNRSAIFAALHVAGVQRVDLVSPAADIVCTATQAGYCTGVDLVFAGNAD